MLTVDDESLRATPICDALISLQSRDIESFHALPLSQSKSLHGSAFRGKYEQMFGQAALDTDLTYTGEVFDTPAVPKHCIDLSRRLTATAFGARFSSYVTTGTTTSNFISVFALCPEGRRVLVDRRCHQSIHFALIKAKARVTYIPCLLKDEDANRSSIDIEALIQRLRQSHQQNDPFRVIILSNCSYEGVIHDVQAIVAACLEIDEDVKFIVDEAWFAHGYFHRLYRPYTAMYAANTLESAVRSLAIVATQSAHKSLSALRQGSYIHVHGDEPTIAAVREAQYTYHTTSPSYPILASLELARAQAVVEGEDRLEMLFQHARRLRQVIADDSVFDGYSVNESQGLKSRHVLIDPLKVSINLQQLTSDVPAFKRSLFDRHGIYVNCVTATSVLFNIHMGLSSSSIDRLLEALSDFVPAKRPRALPRHEQTAPALNHTVGTADMGMPDVSDRYLIPYPPGVPVIVPGDVVTPQVLLEVTRLRDAGIDVLSIRPANSPSGSLSTSSME